MNRLCLPTLWLRNKHPVTTHMIRPFALSLFAAVAVSGAAAAGLPESPSLKPDRPYVSTATDSRNSEILHKALEAAGQYKWSEVARLQEQATDPAVRDLIMWKRASEGVPGMGFDEVNDALTRLHDWPKAGNMRARAEEIIELSTLSANERIAWLRKSGPRTGEGKVALANALREVGMMDDAVEAVRDAWHNNSMDRALERQVLARFGGQLTQADHQARVEFLLWTNQRTAASRLKSLLSSDYRKLVDARIALASRGRNVDALVRAVPDSLKDNPGLLYDRARWRRTHGNQEGAIPLLTQIDGKDVPAAGRSKLWKERSIAMRTDLKDGNWSRAYQLASPHGMTSGGDFAEAGATAFRNHGRWRLDTDQPVTWPVLDRPRRRCAGRNSPRPTGLSRRGKPQIHLLWPARRRTRGRPADLLRTCCQADRGRSRGVRSPPDGQGPTTAG